MKVKILIVILSLLIISINCKQDTAPVPGSDVPTQKKKIDENRMADVRFTFKSSVKTGFIAYPKLSVSQGQDIIVINGEYKAAGEKATLLVKTYTRDLRLIGENVIFLCVPFSFSYRREIIDPVVPLKSNGWCPGR